MAKNPFEYAEELQVDPDVAMAQKLIREQQQRDSLFRLNLILVVVLVLLVIDLWRAYRNEQIWNQCVALEPQFERILRHDQ